MGHRVWVFFPELAMHRCRVGSMEKARRGIEKRGKVHFCNYFCTSDPKTSCFVCLFVLFCFVLFLCFICLESELGYHRDASLTSDSVELYFRHWFALTGRKYFCLIRINHFKVEDEDDPGRVPLTSLVDASCPQLMWEPYSHADGTGHVCTE